MAHNEMSVGRALFRVVSLGLGPRHAISGLEAFGRWQEGSNDIPKRTGCHRLEQVNCKSRTLNGP